MAKISIIVPVYNVEKYLVECLDSIVNQTLTDIEIICVNDGSTDNSLEILKQYSCKDTRIIVIDQLNGGLSDARNTGTKHATGDYVLFVDSDDYIDLKLCEKVYNCAFQSHADMVMFFMQCFGDNQNVPPVASMVLPDEITDTLEKIETVYANWQTAWSNLYYREFLEKNKLAFHKGILFEDLPYVTKAVILSNKIACVKERLYFYRQRDNSIMNENSKKNFLLRPESFRLMFQDIMPLNCPDSCINWLMKIHLDSLYRIGTNDLEGSLKRQFKTALRNNSIPGELQKIKDNTFHLPLKKELYFISAWGSVLDIIMERLKITKYALADWLAHKLIPHSPWLLNLVNQYNKTEENTHNDNDNP